MTAAPHRSHVDATPWAGIYCVRTSSAHEFPKHWHETYGLGLMLDGAHRSSSGRGLVDAFAGDVIASNPGEVHDGRPLGSSTRSWRMLCIEQSAMDRVDPDAAFGSACRAEFTRPVARDARLVSALSTLFRRLEHWKSGAQSRRGDVVACEEALVDACALSIDRDADAPPVAGTPVSHGLQSVRDLLADESCRSPSLAEMAAVAGLTKFQVIRHFERAFGLSPHAWARQHRVERARTFIRDGTSLASTASRCGFADQSHMTRVFVRHFGFTPGAWRRINSWRAV